MDLWEKLQWSACVAGAVVALIAISLLLFTPHTFEGYYLRGDGIYASYKWALDERAYYHNPEMWQTIVDNNLHIEPEK